MTMNNTDVLQEIRPPALIENEEMGERALHLLKLRRRILENEYELQLQAAQRARLRAERAAIEHRLAQERDLPRFDRDHLRARVMEIDAKLWKSQQLTKQFELELTVFMQVLRA